MDKSDRKLFDVMMPYFINLINVVFKTDVHLFEHKYTFCCRICTSGIRRKVKMNDSNTHYFLWSNHFKELKISNDQELMQSQRPAAKTKVGNYVQTPFGKPNE